MVKFNQLLTSFFNRNLISTLDLESDGFGRWNLDGMKSELLTITLVGPNRLSLEGIYRFSHIPFKKELQSSVMHTTSSSKAQCNIPWPQPTEIEIFTFVKVRFEPTFMISLHFFTANTQDLTIARLLILPRSKRWNFQDKQ